jgi:hypothetical protein
MFRLFFLATWILQKRRKTHASTAIGYPIIGGLLYVGYFYLKRTLPTQGNNGKRLLF